RACPARRRRRRTALNEGRDSRPGNGMLLEAVTGGPTRPAQRGPGLASRQRPRGDPGSFLLRSVRSTRAGTRVPATALVEIADGFACRGRSTRAGTRVPATAPSGCGRRSRRPSPLNEGRDSRPGNGQRGPGLASRQRIPLNEGRDSRPGNGPRWHRPSSRRPAALNEGRDARPGHGRAEDFLAAEDPDTAQRGPGLASRQRPHGHDHHGTTSERSTRAGTRVPATGATVDVGAGRRAGARSTRAGTRVPATGATVDVGAGRRAGARSTRAGTRVPATAVPFTETPRPSGHRSTRAGTRVAATDPRQ